MQVNLSEEMIHVLLDIVKQTPTKRLENIVHGDPAVYPVNGIDALVMLQGMYREVRGYHLTNGQG
jgi:hypothetical protein